MSSSKKLDRLIESQKIRNVYSTMMKQSSLKLKNSMLCPQSANNKLGYRSSTSSSVFKRSRKLSPSSRNSLSTYRSRKQKLQPKTQSKAFISHYDKLKKQRSKSMIEKPKSFNTTKQRKLSHQNKQTSVHKYNPPKTCSKKKCTIPKEFTFATKSRNRTKKKAVTTSKPAKTCTASKAQHTKHNKMNTNKAQLYRRKNIKSKRSLSFALPTNTSLSRKNTKFDIRKQKHAKNTNIKKTSSKKLKRNRSASQITNSKTVKRFMNNTTSFRNTISVKSKPSSNGITDATTEKKPSFSFHESEFRKMKKKLRKGITINTNKVRRQSNIQSAYAQRNASNNRKSLLLSPIAEKNTNLVSLKSNNNTDMEDVAIDQILTEDVYTIGNSLTPATIQKIHNIISPRKQYRDTIIAGAQSSTANMHCTNTSIVSTILQDNNSKLNSPVLSPVQLITKKNSFVDELMFKDLMDIKKDKKTLENCNKEIENKFEKLDNLFNQIAFKIN